MVKKALLLLSASLCLLTATKAQKSGCITDEVNNKLKEKYPEIAVYEAKMKAEILASFNKLDLSQLAKTTTDTSTLPNIIYVPLVFHIVHDYGTDEYVTDNEVYNQVEEINKIFNHQNADTTEVIATYKGFIPGTNKRYMGNTRIVFRLASLDPDGNPTHGITRRRSHLSNAGGDQAKYDGWPPQSYMNIWVIKAFDRNHQSAAAYAYKPVTAAVLPQYDGIISFSGQSLNYDNTIAHELGHTINLDHPWGGTNEPEKACGDDEVDDTPPTKGHMGFNCLNLNHLYDTACTYTKTQVGKINLSFFQDRINTANNSGINFKTTINQVYIDTVHFYPRDSNAAYTIALKHGNTTLQTYSGFTNDNKNSLPFGSDFFSYNDAVVDNSTTGSGISFLTYDTCVIKSVNFYSKLPSAAPNPGRPYTIVLKHNGNVINSYSGLTGASGNDTAFVNFPIPTIDSTQGYVMEFSVNPGALKDTSVYYNYANRNYVNFIKIANDVTNGYYNFFYHWNIQLFNYKQVAPVHFFVANMDTAASGKYSIVFTQNPGVKRDSSTGLIYQKTVPDVLEFTTDNTQSLYNNFYDWRVKYGYYKRYGPGQAGKYFGDPTISYVDYPDTVNAQNVMDYTYCSKMFTHLQGVRMRDALNSTIANRNNLGKDFNLYITGVKDSATNTLYPRKDLPAIADFAIDNETVKNAFVCKSARNIPFVNRSWNDTVNKLEWTFPTNSPSVPSATNTGNISYNTGVQVTFADTGWVSASLKATSDVYGVSTTNTITKDRMAYIADDQAISVAGYYQEFDPAGDVGMYPIFNYYKNDFKWEYTTSTGFYDNTSYKYAGYDKRVGSQTFTGTPAGDIDDFFTRAYNLSTFGNGQCNLSFVTAGATVTALPIEMNDSLEIAYSTNCGNTWTTFAKLGKADVANNGTIPYEFYPTSQSQWKAQSISVPTNAKLNKVFFRFRYRPNIGAGYAGTGNNFFLDRISFNSYPTGVNAVTMEDKNFALAPNPTTGSTSVMIKNAKGLANISVTDVTGKVVYRTATNLNGSLSTVEIPANVIAVKGIYLVQVVTGNTKHTEKLVVY